MKSARLEDGRLRRQRNLDSYSGFLSRSSFFSSPPVSASPDVRVAPADALRPGLEEAAEEAAGHLPAVSPEPEQEPAQEVTWDARALAPHPQAVARKEASDVPGGAPVRAVALAEETWDARAGARYSRGAVLQEALAAPAGAPDPRAVKAAAKAQLSAGPAGAQLRARVRPAGRADARRSAPPAGFPAEAPRAAAPPTREEELAPLEPQWVELAGASPRSAAGPRPAFLAAP